MTLAAARSVTKRFDGVVAVNGVDLTVEAGEIVGLLGANGAGKTTLVRMLLGLLAPTEGSIELFGEPPSRSTRGRIGYLPQGLGLYDDLTASENLAFAAAAFGKDASLPRDLKTIGDTLVRDLSLGLKRRVGFAAALQHSPELLMLDEPTSGVDVLSREALWDQIRRATEEGASAIVTTHHMDEAEECDRLVMMASARVVAEGKLEEIVGDRRTVIVHTEEWGRAFELLEAAGLTFGFSGRSLRVIGTGRKEVETVLRSQGIRYLLEEVPATLEEAFALLSREAA